jgi:rhodanese-related sulfurtransferase
MALRDDICQAMENYLLNAPSDWNTITVDQLGGELNAGEKILLLDVREPGEYGSGHLPGAVNVPVRQLPQRVGELPHDKKLKIVAYCASGVRSAYATMFLRTYGYENVRTLAHGIREWIAVGNKVE